VPDALLAERGKSRAAVQEQLERVNADFRLGAPSKDVVEQGYASAVFDEHARTCVECQACTRVCPTCHCFYLYDTKQEDYFGKMKMWDSCMRTGYAEVAGGGNPRKLLGDRLRHRMMHKFAYFLERYGVEMCVGCGRCADAEAGDMDIRVVLKKLSDELTDKGKAVAK
jgi:ferredoxin